MGDIVIDGEYLIDFGDFGFLVEVFDLVFEDCGDFCGLNIY